MKVNIEEVRALYARRREINKMSLNEIEWYEGGKLIEVDSKLIERWQFVGMVNTDFIDTDFYKTTPDE